MRFNHAIPALALLAACAAPAEEYPSLALRPAEVGAVPPVPPPPAPAQPSSATLQQIERLTAQATEAHRAFVAETPRAQNAAEAARRDGTESESWARAQVALSVLQAARAPASIALADIDRLYADAATEGGDVSPIAEARAQVAAQVEEQDRTIAAIAVALD